MNLWFHLVTFCMIFDSLKLECEKLAQEKTEMQRHYVMVISALFVTFSWLPDA